jgi:hypothetical protein
MEILILLVIFMTAVGYWANSWGRNGWLWGIAAAIFSPLLTGIVLLIMGKTIQKKAEEINTINSLTNKN